jgi:zinc protease
MFKFPPLSEYVLDNGVRMIWVTDQEQPAISIALQVPYGRFYDPPGKEGLAELTLALLQKGCASLSTEAFVEKFEYTGSSLWADIGDEHIAVGCRMLAQFAPGIVPLFWEMLVTPAFSDAELKRLKREMITNLQSERADPMTLGHKHFFAEFFGPSHPAGRMHSAESIRRISCADVRSFWEACFVPAGSICIVAGSFNALQAQNSWEGLFKSWARTASAPPGVAPAAGPLTGSVVRIVDKKELSQVTLCIGHGMIGELHPDRNAAALANYILGGGNFSSRLMMRVRVDKGKTYGIGSQILSNSECAAFMISTTTKNEQLGEVLQSIMAVYRNFSEEGVTGSELEKAKQFAVGNLAFQLEGIGNICEKLLWLRHFKRPNTYIENFADMIMAITTAEVNGVIRSFYSSRQFVFAAVGQKTVIEKSMAPFGVCKHVDSRSL